jgi:hypothetical protein
MDNKLLSPLVTLAGVLAGCATTPTGPPSAGIDHVVLAISDLDRGIAQLGEVCGVMPIPGGRHEYTENALLSIDARAYLEVLAPQDGVELPPRLQPLRAVPNLLPMSWAVSIGNADLAARMLGAHGYTVSEPEPGSRQTADGTVVRWRAFQLLAPKIEGAPFFIEWDGSSAHPAATSPPGCPLLSLELHTPQDEELRRLLGLLNQRGQVTRAAAHRMVVTLQGPRGPVRLPSGR